MATHNRRPPDAVTDPTPGTIPDKTGTDRATNQPSPGGATGAGGSGEPERGAADSLPDPGRRGDHVVAGGHGIDTGLAGPPKPAADRKLGGELRMNKRSAEGRGTPKNES
ncbi:MAG: hypothetical protein AB1918_08430 [Pseudomonadota bacterium]